MYGNINSVFGGEFEVAGAAIAADTTTEFDLPYVGVNPDTDMVEGVMFADEADLAKTGAGQPVIRAFIKEANVVTVAVTAIINTVTVAAGAKVRVMVSRNDNSWISNGL